jgi:hypothetical protein
MVPLMKFIPNHYMYKAQNCSNQHGNKVSTSEIATRDKFAGNGSLSKAQCKARITGLALISV